jgi:phage baseplate assembly protein gpV
LGIAGELRTAWFQKSRTQSGWKRTTDGPQTGDQVRSPAEEDGKEPDRGEGQPEKEM